MHQRQGLADKRVAQTCQPAGLLGWQGLEISTNHLDEHQLAQLRQHAFAAGALLGRFHRRQADELAEPVGVVAGLVSGRDHRRQIVDQRIERLGITSEEPADELGGDRSLGAIIDEDRQLTGGGRVERARRSAVSPHARTAGEDMRVASGEDEDIAGLDHDRLLADEVGEATAFGNDVIRDQMPGARQDLREDPLARRLLGDPRGARHDVEERRAGQAHGLQHIR